MRGEFRSHFLVDLLQRWIGVAGVKVRKSALCAVEQTAGAFQGHNGVVECWLFRVVRHHLNFLELIAHAGLDRGREVFVFDLVERRYVIWQRALGEQWVICDIGIFHG